LRLPVLDDVEPTDDELRALYPRPRRRSECADGPRPCPFVSCAEHIAVRVEADGSVTERFDVTDPTNMERPTCRLDVREHGMSLDEVAAHLAVTRERIRQIEASALNKLRHASRLNRLDRPERTWRA